MRGPHFERSVLGCSIAGAFLVACGGPPPPIAPGTMLQTRAISMNQGSWLYPGAPQLRRLLYVSDLSANVVDVYELPKGRIVGTLSGFDGPAGECSDADGDVFITEAFAHDVAEYRHGGKSPIAILSDAGYTPIDCSIDRTTGNLAVTNSYGYGVGTVAVYLAAKGQPEYYTDPSIFQFGFDSYDDAGNLYADGASPSYGDTVFAVLAHRSSTFSNIALNQTFCCTRTPLQWDGSHLAIASLTSATIYRFQISGTYGTLVGSTQLAGSSSVLQFWIENKTLYAPVITNGVPMVSRYSYPAGGNPNKDILGFANPFGATVSIRP